MTTYKRAWELEGFPHAKIINSHCDRYISFVGDHWTDSLGCIANKMQGAFNQKIWTLWSPPKEKKKVTLYAPIRLLKAVTGDFYVLGSYESRKAYYDSGLSIVGWREIVVEVDA